MSEGGPRRVGLWDLLLYIPLGFLAELRGLLPRLAERGRSELDARVVTARSLGRLAVGQARRQAPGVVEELRRRGEGAFGGSNGRNGSSGPKAPAPAPAPEPPSTEPEAPPPPPVSSLPVPHYDALSALQVVPRLEGLDPDQLRLIERYERAHRGRRTILHRIEQLLVPGEPAVAAEPPDA